jgi:hypothetical protein
MESERALPRSFLVSIPLGDRGLRCVWTIGCYALPSQAQKRAAFRSGAYCPLWGRLHSGTPPGPQRASAPVRVARKRYPNSIYTYISSSYQCDARTIMLAVSLDCSGTALILVACGWLSECHASRRPFQGQRSARQARLQASAEDLPPYPPSGGHRRSSPSPSALPLGP